MTRDPVRAIADAVLYEGYVLYPYRPSALKNRQRWTFGGVFPQAFAVQDGGDPWAVETECLFAAAGAARVTVQVRFLHMVAREVQAFDAGAGEAGDAGWRSVPALTHEDELLLPGEEAAEREVELAGLRVDDLAERPVRRAFDIPASRAREILRDAAGRAGAALLRSAHGLSGAVVVAAESLAADRFRLRVRIENTTPLPQHACASRAAAQPAALAAAHAVLRAEDGAFVSTTDPPAELASEAAACVSRGLWPVLVGAERRAPVLLASPIILYDDPQIAPESPGDLFDATEIDEILTLRILTLTEAEKREAAAADPRVRALLARTEALGEADLGKLHGALRTPAGRPRPPPDPGLAVGRRVRLRPRPGADVMDIVLAGQVAIVEAVERDFEDRAHVAVVLEDDPGRDLGLARMPGHRFFFSAEELEPLDEEAPR